MNDQMIMNRAVDVAQLSSNFIAIISDCAGTEGYTLRNALQDRYPLAYWLMNTVYANMMRDFVSDPQKMVKSTEEGVEWELNLPGTVWTLAPVNSGDDCCWTLPDFAKCAGSVPMAMVCLKDCDNIFDTMVYDKLRINGKTSLERFAREGETLADVEKRIRHMWMAFYTMHTMILGTMNTSDNIVKPFHGLLEVLTNSAVISLSGANLLAAFASIGCRLDVLGGSDWVFAANPLIYRSVEAAVVPDENGNLPDGWSRGSDGRLRFHGIGFIDDKLVPVNMTNNTGDIWLIDGESTGAVLGYNVGDEYEINQDFTEQTKANGCGQVCNYLYNYGTVGNGNANRVMVISNVPISSACTQIADLAELINPKTLVPAV